MTIMPAVKQAVETLLDHPGAWKATKYLTQRSIVRATRVRKNRTTIVLSFGRPNYQEAEFIKKARKAGEAFPIRKVQLRMLPKPKKKKK